LKVELSKHKATGYFYMKYLIILLALNACLLWFMLVVGLISRLLSLWRTKKPAQALTQEKYDGEYLGVESAKLCTAFVASKTLHR
jgi:hypothetical protein